MEKVLNEIDTADSEGKLSEFVTWKESNNMVYLQACIKEALRKGISVLRGWATLKVGSGMHPAVGLLLERHVPQGGVTLDGHYIPEGTVVGVNPWVSA